MCMEDIRIGRELGPDTPLRQTSTSAIVEICKMDQQRTRLIVTSDATDKVLLYPSSYVLGGFYLHVLTITNPTVILRVEDYGKLLYESWSAIAPTGPTEIVSQSLSTTRQ